MNRKCPCGTRIVIHGAGVPQWASKHCRACIGKLCRKAFGPSKGELIQSGRTPPTMTAVAKRQKWKKIKKQLMKGERI